MLSKQLLSIFINLRKKSESTKGLDVLSIIQNISFNREVKAPLETYVIFGFAVTVKCK